MMNLYHAIVIDDEELACDEMERKLSNTKLFDLLGCFNTVADAQYFLRSHRQPVDFIFCDIELGDTDGLVAATSLKKHCSFFVCCTGHTHYALDAHKQLVDGFLVKPVDETLLLALIDKLQEKNLKISKPPLHTILLDAIATIDGADQSVGKKKRMLLQVALHDIRYLKMKGNYLYAYGAKSNNAFPPIGRINITIKYFMAKFGHMENLIRINPSEIVNMNHMYMYSDGVITIEKEAFFVNGHGIKHINSWLLKHLPNS
ncbi:response regulator [Sphingobacterium sp.]|uniref:LytR/AlgR family response regulator transcription factor n=1 Tax=Sphingobacterium sp. TaxID=341027 RepID=UPI0028989517|nr:response regulator [Sphingobacterium sp.]